MGEQLAAQSTTGVGTGEVLGPKTPGIQQSQGQRVAQRHLGGGTGGGRQIQRAGFLGHGAVQPQVGMLGHGGLGVAGHGQQRRAQAFEDGQQDCHLLRFAAVGNGQYQILRGDHAQVAVAGLARVHKHGRGASRGQGSSDLAAHVSALAHAHDDHPAANAQHHLHRPGKGGSDTVFKLHHRIGFYLQGLLGQGNSALGMRFGCRMYGGCHAGIL